ncbi:flavin reductase [Carboxylicivirga sediminis]|uniref:Flavin reductase n=1 Tax=Carboxylicivirga sediminis TaxID=2006564 RepID=A0A941F123_9BACT|nr:flavin reductase [Carboxylicivirga sediminis]MBR8534921.1 flavin reductase [Carboxylicivirga sediminis]
MNIEAFFKLTYGLYIITTKDDNKLNGYIANTAFQVTAEPSQIAISCSKNNLSCQMIENSGVFSISILKQNVSADIIGLFGYKSGSEINKFEHINYKTGKSGVPIVTQDCLAWFECKVNKAVDVGTHILFIATIEDNELLDKSGTPLTYAYYHEVKKGLAPKNAPTYIDESKLKKSTYESKGKLQKYKCLACGYIYDPELGDEDSGITPGTAFEDIPDDWICPTCGSTKDMFTPI